MSKTFGEMGGVGVSQAVLSLREMLLNVPIKKGILFTSSTYFYMAKNKTKNLRKPFL